MQYKEINDYELLYLVGENSELAYDTINRKYTPIIFQLVNKYLPISKKFGFERDDLYQVGYLGLYQAIKSYRDTNGSLFYTYALKCIENSIKYELRVNQTNKKKTLNKAISYDLIQDDFSCSYSELFPDHFFCDDLMNLYSDYETRHSSYLSIKSNLTIIEISVLELRINYYTTEEISELLDISLEKVKKILAKINRLILNKKKEV